MMEEKIDHEKPVPEQIKEIADNLSHKADEEGVTGFMYGCAVNVLSQIWIYGEELRVWHNKEWGVDDPDIRGTVNPAILNIKIKT